MNGEEKVFTLELNAKAVDIVMAGLGELAFKHSQPVFDLIRRQLIEQAEVSPPTPPLQDKVIP